MSITLAKIFYTYQTILSDIIKNRQKDKSYPTGMTIQETAIYVVFSFYSSYFVTTLFPLLDTVYLEINCGHRRIFSSGKANSLRILYGIWMRLISPISHSRHVPPESPALKNVTKICLYFCNPSIRAALEENGSLVAHFWYILRTILYHFYTTILTSLSLIFLSVDRSPCLNRWRTLNALTSLMPRSNYVREGRTPPPRRTALIWGNFNHFSRSLPQQQPG